MKLFDLDLVLLAMTVVMAGVLVWPRRQCKAVQHRLGGIECAPKISMTGSKISIAAFADDLEK